MNQKISALEVQFENVKKILQVLADKSDDMAEQQLLALVRESQYFVLDARKLWAGTISSQNMEEQMSIVAPVVAEGFEIQIASNKVIINMPILLPKRKPLQMNCYLDALEMFLQIYRQKLPRFRNATVIFHHFYAPDFPERDIRDHDNHETRAVLNVLERFLLESDSAVFCTNVQQTQRGTETMTRVIILQGQIDLEAIL